jgi:hypothetical protein
MDKKHECPKCKNLFSNRGGNLEKHINACNGVYKPFQKRNECVHCNFAFDGKNSSERANHTRWCDKNPKRESYNKNLEIQRSKITDESRVKQALGVKKAHEDGKYKDSGIKGVATRKKNGNLHHTEETKQLLREKALASNHRRVLRSTRIYVKKDGTEVLLDSSWEEALAKRLDFLNIEWTRPAPVKWVDDEGKSHNYFPDFYLTEHDIFLDPKNDIVYNSSIDKINKLKEVLPNLTIIRTLKECKEYDVATLA